MGEDALAVIRLVPPIGRVETEQGEGLVVAADELGPVEALDMGALERERVRP